jgi:thiamine biosynthesis lipoprotein
LNEPGTARWRALGTSAAIVVSDRGALAGARAAVEAELAAVDLACSRFRPDSDLSRLNAGAGRPVRVGALLLDAIAVALRAAVLTDGIVDPTIGRALILAGYDRDFATLAHARTRLIATRVEGWQTVSVDEARSEVRLPRGVLLDLGATAKALAADRAAAAATAAAPGAGVLVNLGGDIAVAGPAPSSGWAVRVADDHQAPPGAPGQSLAISTGGLATSSTTVRRWGPDVHHIIDPRTGLPADSPWRTVSVAAANCVDANVASTAAIVLGDDAPGWLEARALPARLVDHEGARLMVAGWPRELAPA